MTPVWAQLGYLAAAVCFIVALKGLSSPRTARRGNLIGAVGAVLACVIVVLASDLDHLGWILIAVAVGTVIGVLAAYRVRMTQMPQLVALFNGVGGAAAAIVALVELEAVSRAGSAPVFDLIATAFTIVVGSVSFTGSVVTFLKLQELMTGRPIAFAGYPILYGFALVSAVGFAVGLVLVPSLILGLALALIGAGVGVLLVLPVGGADVPIVISLLNAFTGLSVAASGYVLGNTLLLVAGTLVGAAGTLLTKLMATAMGRPLGATLFGALRGGSTLGAGEASDRPVKSVSPADVAILLAYANRVIIVPGYGLAVAQAQHTLRQLVDVLTERGIQVDYAIHPDRRPDAGTHERPLGRGAGAVRATQGGRRDRPGVPPGRRRARGRRERRGQSGRRDHPGGPDLRDADPARQRRPPGRVPQALHAPRLRRHRERAALRAGHHPALRRRQGLSRPTPRRGEGPQGVLSRERRRDRATTKEAGPSAIRASGSSNGTGHRRHPPTAYGCRL